MPTQPPHTQLTPEAPALLWRWWWEGGGGGEYLQGTTHPGSCRLVSRKILAGVSVRYQTHAPLRLRLTDALDPQAVTQTTGRGTTRAYYAEGDQP